ncbi:MAG: DUF502 domain-containing protein [Candidatus Marinimicrobia bacterium]|nr:DUF502 domain-containing protein [Candidatus Neomarinimicrobiota bacterium]
MKPIWPQIKISLRNKLITGIIALIPIAVTVYFFKLFINLFDNMVRPALDPLIGFHIPGLGLVISILIIYLLGVVMTNVLGKAIFQLFEKWLNHVPLIRTVYQTTKQILGAFSMSKSGFERVVFVEYPRKECWTLGFVTGNSVGKDGKKFVNVFLPTTPNPTSGWALFIEEKDVLPSEMTIEQGLKVIISGGAIAPQQLNIVGEKKKE